MANLKGTLPSGIFAYHLHKLLMNRFLRVNGKQLMGCEGVRGDPTSFHQHHFPTKVADPRPLIHLLMIGVLSIRF